MLLLRSLLQEGGGEIHPSVRSPVISIPFTRIKPPHFWVLPPAPEAPGVGTSPGPLLLATPSLGSLISLKEPVFFYQTSYFVMGFSLLTSNIVIVLSEQQRGLRESILRQVDKKSRVPEEERRVWGSQRGDRGLEFSRRTEGQTYFFSSIFLSKDYITAMYPS